MNARKKSKQPSIASEEGKRKWPAWGEPSKEERLVPPPKWKIWIATRRVSLQNAILLSLDYDPTFFKGESISHLLDNDPVKGRFQERIDMLRDCHTGPTIRLSDFASLAESEFKWEGLPGELVALEKKSTGTSIGIFNPAEGAAARSSKPSKSRIATIVKLAKEKKYNLTKIPRGGKAEIMRECLANYRNEPDQFTKDTFKKSWQAARNEGLIDVEGVEIYRGK